MRTMSDVRVQAMQHNNHSSWFILRQVTVINQLYYSLFLVLHHKLHEVLLRKHMSLLRIAPTLLVLFSLFDAFLLLFVCEFDVVEVLLQFGMVLHRNYNIKLS